MLSENCSKLELSTKDGLVTQPVRPGTDCCRVFGPNLSFPFRCPGSAGSGPCPFLRGIGLKTLTIGAGRWQMGTCLQKYYANTFPALYPFTCSIRWLAARARKEIIGNSSLIFLNGTGSTSVPRTGCCWETFLAFGQRKGFSQPYTCATQP